MDFFQRKTTWTNAEFIWLKLSVASAFLIIGAQYADFFSKYFQWIFIVFALSVIRAVFLWIKKMDAPKK
ncbi:hypothetical protein G4D82_09880 [Flavobacterium sp. CYK-4]|uniref:hypothetical protein n=1 Tax=Flavobacterium lotistagni TaxID=2709660 RepID=UPI001408ADFC|nr:hypothetical protein [Flavobacterium lotistagni]NHM07529.1 hypothetical protein [Flavobacterium lotistagni]